MRSPYVLFVFLLLHLLLDLYVYFSLKILFRQSSDLARTIAFFLYWGISALSMGMILFWPYIIKAGLVHPLRSHVFGALAALFISKLLALSFFLIDDIRRFFQWSWLRVFSTPARAGEHIVAPSAGDEPISRSVFMSWLGLLAGGGLFSSFIYGFGNKYAYRVVRQTLSFENLPSAFRGMRVLHISDIHSGSFTDKEAVRRGVDMILAEKPDLIVFTGDLVNNMASEMEAYQELFARLQAPLGVFSILGNHDYGDYVAWPVDGVDKGENLKRLKAVHAAMGWRLLLNEHVVLTQGQDRIALLGVENWSAKARFPKYGRLTEAYQGAEEIPFKVLLTHDPSHWDAEVRQDFPDIDLTLSGHTHGMQFGVEVPGWRWSPVQYVYRNWAGLYSEGRQHLYVNRGFGFIGYPGRVGVLPEITVLTLNA